jgi:hypothetical protein
LLTVPSIFHKLTRPSTTKKENLYMKFTIEVNSPEEARKLLDAVTGQGFTHNGDTVVRVPSALEVIGPVLAAQGYGVGGGNVEFVQAQKDTNVLYSNVGNEISTSPAVNAFSAGTPTPANTLAGSDVPAFLRNVQGVEADEAPATTPEGFDRHGLPWDARIHSSNGKQTAKGEWQKRRGVTDGLVAQVEAELRARLAPVPGFPVAPAATGLPVPPAPAVNFVPAPPTVTTGGVTYQMVMEKVSSLIAANQAYGQNIMAALQYEGIPDVPTVGTKDPATIARVYEALGKIA